MPLPREDDEQGENWFKWENSQAERRSLLHLERELVAMFYFEHGDGEEGGSRASPIWVMCILLEWLFSER